MFRPIRRLIVSLLAILLAVAGPAAAQSAALAELGDDLRRILAAQGGRGARHGVLVVSLDRGDTLFALNADAALAPASNLKLFATAAALFYLGPDFRFSTLLLADGPVRDGVLEGDLVLRGTGDPALSGRLLPSALAPLHALADSLRGLGVRRVAGDLVADGSYFDADWRGAAWNPGDLLAWYAAPVGALSFAENMVTVRVLPGEAGAAARIRTTPETVGLAIRNEVRTVSRGATSVQFRHGPGGLVASGQVSRGSVGVSRTVPVSDPNNYAAAALRAVLAARGIEVAGRTRAAEPAETRGRARVVAVHLSPTLAELATVTNHVSHNLFADALMKTVGRVVTGEGSWAGGERAVEGFLARAAGVDPATLELRDGSGLSRTNRVSARATVALLDFMARDRTRDAYLASLPEAGSQRGLRRMFGTAAADNLRAKTGTIRAVSALSGYVRSADGELLAFSILANDVPSTGRAKQAEDAIGARIARFRRGEAGAVAAPGGGR